jgi:Peptidase C13 family
MLKGLALVTALLGTALTVGEACAQGGDPLRGNFGAIEVAMPPGEAAEDVGRMADVLKALPPQRPGVVDTYVLSASFWNDPVFESEAKEAAVVLGRRFDATERTVVLSAGRGANTTRNFPAATPNNFQAALGRIGKLIDPKEDLVVVFVTSHGGPDGAVGLQETGRMGGSMRAQHLRMSLQQAGIPNKVVIISACFSGAFILPFSDDNTVILTAAAADKTSFGCEPSRDWTFFGDALFNHALRGGGSLIESYDDALGLIGGWEKNLHDNWLALSSAQRKGQPEPQPSNPQREAGATALALVDKAESYGMAISCAGHLSFAADRARTGRPLKGLNDLNALAKSIVAAQDKAAAEAPKRGRSQQDIAKAIAATSASVLQIFSTQAPDVTAHALKCLGPAG